MSESLSQAVGEAVPSLPIPNLLLILSGDVYFKELFKDKKNTPFLGVFSEDLRPCMQKPDLLLFSALTTMSIHIFLLPFAFPFVAIPILAMVVRQRVKPPIFGIS